MEYASQSLDTGAGILRKALKAGNRSLDLPMLAGINARRRSLGLDEVVPPHGCKLHRQLQIIAEARALVARIDSERR
jgi:hypothetical protein